MKPRTTRDDQNWYARQLRDPRWQKKRLETLQAHGWKCDLCGDTTRELHVDHKRYSGFPWEIPDADLQVLCFLCHRKRHRKAEPPPDNRPASFKAYERGHLPKFES